ncbi:hypothetical protein [Staphylococcus capitis]|uniref:hypothetical protein n=1 Tax=Staphylococcus capitis TaxID=29388 RepID=UPI00382E7D78
MGKQEIKRWISENLLTKKEIINKYNLNPSFFDVNVTRKKIQPFIKKSINLYLKDDIEKFLNEYKSPKIKSSNNN